MTTSNYRIPVHYCILELASFEERGISIHMQISGRVFSGLKTCRSKSIIENVVDKSIIYNYPPKGRWIVMGIYRDSKRRGIYPPLFTDPEGDSCFSIYQIRWIKKCCFNFFFWNFRETTCHFSFRSQPSEYPRIFRVTGANQTHENCNPLIW